MTILTHNPRTGLAAESRFSVTAPADVEAAAADAAAAALVLADSDRARRSELLERIADIADAREIELVEIADRETGLGVERLRGELRRSSYQFRLFAEVVRDGGYLEAAIDHAEATALGPAPDVRRMLVALGPVAVFGSSNFPFAFSVLGGDTASALAAGCPVVLKAHSSHSETSALSFDVLREAVQECGFPDATVQIVFGQEAGTALVKESPIAAVSFTGSLGAAEALSAAMAERDQVIPFFGELSSINPLVITRAAAAARATDIARGLFASVTGSGGQLCTKPGIAFVPTGVAGDELVRSIADLSAQSGTAVLLNKRIAESFAQIVGRLVAAGAVRIATGIDDSSEGYRARPTVLEADASEVGPELAEECFGPVIVLVRYGDDGEVVRALSRIPASLTATIHSEDGDELGPLIDAARATSGRMVFDGFPTGVRVSWAQNHGGPWPSTNSQHTSVGATAIRRFLRPFAWQDAPQYLLPPELRDGAVTVPRRVDGVLALASVAQL